MVLNNFTKMSYFVIMNVYSENLVSFSVEVFLVNKFKKEIGEPIHKRPFLMKNSVVFIFFLSKLVCFLGQ